MMLKTFEVTGQLDETIGNEFMIRSTSTHSTALQQQAFLLIIEEGEESLQEYNDSVR